jgi:cobyrinic acid a,c-diamide synthase
LPATVFTEPQRERSHAEPVFRSGRLHASFMHLYFPSNPVAVAQLFAPN